MGDEGCHYSHGLFKNGSLISGQIVFRKIGVSSVFLAIKEGTWNENDDTLTGIDVQKTGQFESWDDTQPNFEAQFRGKIGEINKNFDRFQEYNCQQGEQFHNEITYGSQQIMSPAHTF